jgi:hypothetical protein
MDCNFDTIWVVRLKVSNTFLMKAKNLIYNNFNELCSISLNQIMAYRNVSIHKVTYIYRSLLPFYL